MKFSIVVPVYNAQLTITDLVCSLHESLSDDDSYEIILVNDGSMDDSHSHCLELQKKYPNGVVYIELMKNFGEHNAVLAGLQEAKGDSIIVMDDDFQNPIQEVINLMIFSQENLQYDVIYTFYEKKQHSFLRNVGSMFNDKIANLILKKPKGLYLSSFKLIRKYIVNEIIRYRNPYPYIDGLILRTTKKIGRLKVSHAKRKEGESNYTFKKLVSLWLSMATNFSVFPLRIATFFGILSGIIGMILGAIFIYEKLTDAILPKGWTALALIICFFSTIQLLSLGLIGEYVGRIFISLNNKPQYIIRNKYDRK